MGYERKRGKLAELNSLLRAAGRDRFALVVGATAVLSSVRYVITLDTDTELPRDSALQFVGAMAHPLNRPRFGTTGKRKAGERVTEGYGILQPRVSIGLPGANRSWFARLQQRRAGRRPVHARRLRRLPGRVRRRLVHRQGDLRRRRVRTRPRRTLSREPDPEPRPARGLLRAVGVAERRATLRGIPVHLSRRHRPATPLDPRRLAAGRVAAAARTGSRRATGGEPAVGAFAVEALRQPAAQPGPGRADPVAAGGLGGAGACLALDRGGDRGPRSAVGKRPAARSRAQAGRGPAAAAPGRRAPDGRRARGAGRPGARVPAVRGDDEPRRDRAHRMAPVRVAPTAAGMESVGRGRGGSPAGRWCNRTLRARSLAPGRCGLPRSSRRRP